MAREEKPYRVYKGGRARGKVPAPPRPERRPRGQNGRTDYKGPGTRRSRRRLTRGRRIGLIVLVVLVLLVAWGAAGYLSFRGGVAEANDRLPAAARTGLTPQSGLLLSHPTTILLLGTDHADLPGRETLQHSDSIMLVRADPKRHKITYLSIPRDLHVPIPGYRDQKINAAFQLGGPALAVKTIRDFTGLEIDHIAIVDFAYFEDLVDALGGVDVVNPAPILSNNFDCPYDEAKCRTWQGWRFSKGKIHLDGRKALIYSRIRENRLDPSESDVTRVERQQRVLQAIATKLTSIGTMARLPLIGGDLLRPLATDLSAGQFLQLGWVKFRTAASTTLHCRLGGDAISYGGQSVIEPNEENRSVISMFLGTSAPQPPLPGSGPFGPGCAVGDAKLGNR
jgi:LCP family protein required for cell wall assembly